MDETERQMIDENARRGSPVPQWEVFVRTEETGPLKHVGSVAAEESADAYDQASELFGWAAVDLWLCPAGEVKRYSARTFGGVEADDGEVGTDGQLSANPAGIPEVSDS